MLTVFVDGLWLLFEAFVAWWREDVVEALHELLDLAEELTDV